MRFVKMHGCGNDYIYVDCFTQAAPQNPGELSQRLSAPHTGIGSDGLILMLPSNSADARMRIFNKDASEGDMCGNGIRCVGKYLYDSGLVRKQVMTIETRGGIKTLEMLTEGDVATGARVDMGVMSFNPAEIPVRSACNEVDVQYNGRSLHFFCLNAGNPHAVCFDYYPDDEEFYKVGPQMENHPVFPERANISFAKTVNASFIKARIWERGSGATMACGSGATATQVAAYMLGKTNKKATVELPGGCIDVEYNPETRRAFMTGPAVTVFRGEIDI
ncbi:MAG: diaminopimelate epimerase [Clostridia bacterium]|nr:diaminopimelate epimerase [Clostridia bacterium]